MKRTVFSLLAAFALCVSAAAVGPAVSCPSALLMEKQTGTVLFAQDEHTPREPASVTKIMTLLLVMEAIDSGALSYDDVVTGSAHAAGMGGSQIWLKENEQMTVRDAAGNTVAELPILAGEDVGHVTFVQMLGRCLARGFCMGPRS